MFSNFLTAVQDQATAAYAQASLFAEGNNWSIEKAMTGLFKWLQKYGGYALQITGVVAFVWAIYNAFRKGMGSQEVRSGWVAIIAVGVFGAAMMLMGWTLTSQIASGLKETVSGFGTGETENPSSIIN